MKIPQDEYLGSGRKEMGRAWDRGIALHGRDGLMHNINVYSSSS